jgi:OFA family oxalate/formate antiporter-like MFS transporter
MMGNSSAGLRWLNLVAAILLLICTGSIYAFSVFSGPLAILRG